MTIHRAPTSSPHCHNFTTQSAKPQWDEFFAFELVAPAFAVLKVKVMDHMHCWRPQMLGEVSQEVKVKSWLWQILFAYVIHPLTTDQCHFVDMEWCLP